MNDDGGDGDHHDGKFIKEWASSSNKKSFWLNTDASQPFILQMWWGL